MGYPSFRVSAAVDCDVKRPPVVTFRDIEFDDDGEEDEVEFVPAKREPQSQKNPSLIHLSRKKRKEKKF